ncbi:MAG: YabP/YqfC family sporulation protein [Oscillospiraceae bacterium]|nr:YabP/YqfC family sporulation protein [Oscillospiraceae bacterium]
MAYETAVKAAELPHNLTLEGRRKLTVSGVTDVESLNEE